MNAGTRLPALGATRTLCPFCSAAPDPAREVIGAERMSGLGGSFHYHSCSACGSLWLADVPDLAPYYPQDYYAFAPAGDHGALRRRLHELARGVVDALEWRFPALAGPRHLIALARTLGVAPATRVLDVGCGDGRFLRRLERVGVRAPVGVDPFAPSGPSGGIEIVRGTIFDVDATFDIIFFNHSLEHDAAPAASLARARSMLASAGIVVVRLPVVNQAFRLFGACWVQLDAPRHLSLPTIGGMRALAARSGFDVARIVFDSTSFQFWGSRAYVRGETLTRAAPAPLSPRWFAMCAATIPDSLRAARWNARGLGDQAAFVLKVAG